jgi:hypothetical protein
MSKGFNNTYTRHSSKPGVNSAKVIFWSSITRKLRWTLLIILILLTLITLNTGPGRLSDPVSVSKGMIPDLIEIKEPKVHGRQSSGNAFTFAAEQGTIADKGNNELVMQDLDAFYNLDKNALVRITAQTGKLVQSENRLWLEGEVIAEHSDGRKIKTQAVEIWSGSNGIIARGSGLAKIEDPSITINSRGFSIDTATQKVLLKGPISMRGNQN